MNIYISAFPTIVGYFYIYFIRQIKDLVYKQNNNNMNRKF